ncbi:hypothetical protein ACFLU4_07305 [Chloroflexota bacterium]
MGKDFPRIEEKVVEVINAFKNHNDKYLDEKDTERICHLLMPYCEYGISLLDRITQAEQTLFSLTENQCRLLEFISKYNEALIEGCAGSGKTY